MSDEQEPMKVHGVSVKPGPGTIGMNMLIVLAIAGMVAVVSITVQNDWIIAALVVGVGVLAWSVIQKNFHFAEKFPHVALLNSSDLREVLIHEVVAKGGLAPPATAPVIENPSYREIEQGEVEQ